MKNDTASTSESTTPAFKPDWGHDRRYPLLQVDQLSVQYDRRTALEEVSFTVTQSERLAVVGPNGAGKSTLFKAIVGVLPPSHGSVHIYGEQPGVHICIAYVPQRSQVDWDFPVNVLDVVLMGRTRKRGVFRPFRREDEQAARQSLAEVGLANLAKSPIHQLSGGQQQRMFIARALAQEAELILMDEPLTGLDIPSQEEIFHIWDLLKRQGVTVMVALHDLKIAADRFDRVMLLNRRIVGIGSPAEAFTTANLQAAYGQRIAIAAESDVLSALTDTCCGEGEEHHHA